MYIEIVDFDVLIPHLAKIASSLLTDFWKNTDISSFHLN